MTSSYGEMVFRLRLSEGGGPATLALDAPGAADQPPDVPVPVVSNGVAFLAPAPTSAENWKLEYSWDDATHVGSVALVNAASGNVSGPKVLSSQAGVAGVQGTAPAPSDFCNIEALLSGTLPESVFLSLSRVGGEGLVLGYPIPDTPAGGSLAWTPPATEGRSNAFELTPVDMIHDWRGPIVEWGNYESHGTAVMSMLTPLFNMFQPTEWGTTFLPTLLFWLYDFPYIHPDNPALWQQMADTQIYPLYATYVLGDPPPVGWGTGDPPPPPPPPAVR